MAESEPVGAAIEVWPSHWATLVPVVPVVHERLRRLGEKVIAGLRGGTALIAGRAAQIG